MTIFAGTWVSGLNRATYNRLAVLAHGPQVRTLPSPPQPTCSTDSLNYPWSASLGRSQRKGLANLFHFGSCARRRQGQNDVPQLQHPLQEIR